MKRKLKAFISYSHNDMNYKLSLLTHFESINKLYNIDFWHDGLIDAGGHIDSEVMAELDTSDIIILLISSSYISSNFCYNIEMERAFQREKNGECIIVPVLLKKTSLNESMPFYNLKTFPTDRKPISSFRSRNDGYVDVTEGLTTLIRNYVKKDTKNKEIVKKTSPKLASTEFKPVTLPYINIAQDGKISPYTLNQELISLITRSNKNMAEISGRFNELVMDHSVKYANKVNKKKDHRLTPKEKRTMLQLFLFDLFIEIKTWFFNYGGVRLHARGLIKNKYNCIIALSDEQSNAINIDWTKELKEMSLNSMIHSSSILGVPMVKSLNPKQHEKGNNDTTWVDYLTCSFNNIYHSPDPLISFGISIHKSSIKYYKNLLLVLAYLRIDLRIENAIKHYIKICNNVDNSYDLKNIINSFA